MDSAIFGATIAIVILSKLKVSRWDKRFDIPLAGGVVAISLLGNAYHAFHAAIAAQATVNSGGVLGFVPLAPVVAAAIATIPPVLVLAFTHGVGILIKAIGAAHAQYSELVRSIGRLHASSARGPRCCGIRAYCPEVAPIETTVDVEPVGGISSDPDDITAEPAVAPIINAVAPTDATPIETESGSTEFASDPLQAEPQTVAQLLEFIDRSDLNPMVKTTATLKINNPDLTFAELAEATNVRAASTAMRRYNRAEDAAIAAGFTIPPLPTLDDIAREALETERNEDGQTEGDQRNDLESQLVHS
ncbi:excisionase [Rhodococcus sp. (in: high G+C Gram-positive bacteria)]|uniref:excisionase n=1 Tax=Rhodococcus sp. TaxID=1831 RepID=UPI00257D75A6|nr:excisionase [Rhodococcus sp. (in: high G+C Gram-positive bacteria)]